MFSSSSMQMSRFCKLLPLLFFLCFHFSPSNGFNSSAVKADVGVILDLQTTVGKIFKTCISMAVEDFYSKNSYSTMIVPHFVDSSSDVVGAASAAIDLLKNTQVVAIFGPQTSTQADFVIDIGDKVKVPIISPATSPSLSPQESPYFIRSSWCSSSQAKAVASIIKNFGWREVVFIYEDSDYASGLVPLLTEELQKSNALFSCQSAVSPSAEYDQILQQLYELKKKPARVFVVHMAPPLASRFFQIVREAGMMSKGYVWIIADPLTSLLDSETIEAIQGVLGVKAYFSKSDEVINFTRRWRKRFHKDNPNMDRTELNVFGLWAYDSMAALAEGVERVGISLPKFKERAERGDLTDFEAIGTSRTGPSLAPLIRSFRSKGLSGNFNISDGELQPSAFEIVNVIGNGVNTVGFWTEQNDISKELNSLRKEDLAIIWPGQTTNLPKGWEFPSSGKKLRVGVPVKKGFSEFVKVEKDAETNSVKATGFCIDVFEEVVRSLPYVDEVQIEYIPFGMLDGQADKYYYDDLVYQVFLQNYDAVVGDVTILGNRSKYVDFTVPYTEPGVATVVPIKDDKTKNAWIFLKPLTVGLWLTIGAFSIFTGSVVWVLEHRVNQEFRGPPTQQVGTTLWFSFSTLVFAHREIVISNLTRFVVIVWLFVVLVLTSSYNANLTSMLTIQQLKSTDIVKKGEYVGYQTGSFGTRFLKGMIFGTYNTRNYSSLEEYEDALSKGSRNGGAAAIVDEIPYLRLFLSKYCQKYTLINPTYETSGFGFAFRKGSPLVSDFSTAILNLRESGKIDMITRSWIGAENCSADDGLESLDLDRFTGLFLIAGVSSSTALAVFFSTFVYENRHILTSSASFKKKLHDLTRAFVGEKHDASKHSENNEEIVLAQSPSVRTSCDEEGIFSQDEELSTTDVEVQVDNS